MSQPSLCMIFEAIGPYNAIGKIAATEVRAALKAGYRVSVVAHRLDEELRDDVEWLRLYNPSRGFALKWLTARYFIRKALGERRFDVIHGHQPQIADLCDVFQCHFLTRVASERGCLVSGSGVRAAIRRWQQEVVVGAEDRHYRNWNPRTRMLFVSELVQREFARLYGLPPAHEILENAPPRWNPVDGEERAAARQRFGLSDEHRPVVGYLGGLQRRKGYDLLLDAAAQTPGIMVLLAGQHTRDFRDDRLGGRLRTFGLVEPRSFLAACDVLIVPSRFDPCPTVPLEAASCGIPVIASEGVGNRHTLVEAEAGCAWDAPAPLMPVIEAVTGSRQRFQDGCRRLCESYSEKRMLEYLLHIYSSCIDRLSHSATYALSAEVVS